MHGNLVKYDIRQRPQSGGMRKELNYGEKI